MELAYLLGGNWFLARLMELFDSLLVVPEILLATDKDDGKTTAEMQYFGNPLLSTCQRFLIWKLKVESLRGNRTFS